MVPHDGPFGRLLVACGWHPWRPAHVHLIVSAGEHEPLVTQLFLDSSDYLDSDIAGAVKDPLVVHPQRNGDQLAFDYGPGLQVHPHVFRSALAQEPGVIEYQVRQTTSG